MDKWKYLIVRHSELSGSVEQIRSRGFTERNTTERNSAANIFYINGSHEYLIEFFNDLGSNGWELVAVSGTRVQVYFFKCRNQPISDKT